MSKESDFLIYCMERYRYFKGLSGADVAKTFDEYGIYRYITRYFESLHTMGDHCIVQDIDVFTPLSFRRGALTDRTVLLLSGGNPQAAFAKC